MCLLWQIALRQTETNTITTVCFKLTLIDNNPINLVVAVLMTDDEGASLVLYEFTIINICDNEARFQIKRITREILQK